MVELWRVLYLVTLALFMTASASIISWLHGVVGILDPFAALLTLAACPFILWMGAVSKRNLEEQLSRNRGMEGGER